MRNLYFDEPARKLACKESYDVVVAGAGPAGIAAALSSARQGARTCLLEAHGALGGVWTTGLLSWVIDSVGKKGIMREIIDRLNQRGARTPKGKGFAYDVEEMKLLLEELCVESKIDIHLHTRVVSVVKEGRRLLGVVTESKSGREAFAGKVFIDTTGDGDLAALAGCQYDYGDPVEGRAQPMSLVALICGVHAQQIAPFVGGGVQQAKINLYEEFRRAGVTPSYSAPTLFRIRDDLFSIVANHEYKVSPMSATQITEATIRARAEIHHLIQALRKLGGPWEGIRVVATAGQIGVREGRRIHGRYQVTAEDVFTGRIHEDAICLVNAGIDVHSTNPDKGTAYEKAPRQSRPYTIPLRALIASDVDGLMMAGRCISGDFLAHSSYRMTGNAVVMGEAAGITAAKAVERGTDPHDLDWESLVPCLDRAGLLNVQTAL